MNTKCCVLNGRMNAVAYLIIVHSIKVRLAHATVPIRIVEYSALRHQFMLKPANQIRIPFDLD